MITRIEIEDIENAIDEKMFSSKDSMKKTVDETVFYTVITKVNNGCTDIVENTISSVLQPIHVLENHLRKMYGNREA